MKMRILIYGTVLGFIVGCCLMTAIYYTAPDVVESQPHFPTPAEIQQQLVDAGYDIDVDGIIGTETLKAWDKALCTQYASTHDYFYEPKQCPEKR